MKKSIVYFVLFSISLVLNNTLFSQTIASKRAATLGIGMNLSYLENYWLGTKANHYGDFLKMSEVMKRKSMIADIAKEGFKTIRMPVCFSAFASIQAPYQWDYPLGLTATDSLIKWCMNNGLKVVIDLHHPEYNGLIPEANTIDRKLFLWKSVAERYKNTDPEKVFFELQNEPHDITAEEWRAEANQLISAVRAIAPRHTLVVGFHDWNSREGLLKSEPFDDPNIIYTFHYYDPFIFTHQGATWTSPEVRDLRNIPFPSPPDNSTLVVPPSAKGTWVEYNVTHYARYGTPEAIYNALAKAKDWSVQKNVPIFLGEFGSYSNFADADSRCRHANAVYDALTALDIPSAWWEWNGGFNMFQKGTTALSPCIKSDIGNYVLKTLGLSKTPELTDVDILSNARQDVFTIKSTGNTVYSAQLINLQGKSIAKKKLSKKKLTVNKQQSGTYILKFFDAKNRIIGYKKVEKP